MLMWLLLWWHVSMTKRRFLVSLMILLPVLAALVAGPGYAVDRRPAGGSDSPSDHRLQPWALPIADVPGVFPGVANDVVVDLAGAIWIATTAGAVRFDPTARTWRIFTVADGLAANEVSSIFVTSDGRVILATWAKAISVRDPGADSFRTIRTEDDQFISVDSIFEDSFGNIWLSGFGSRFYRWAPGSSRLVPQQRNAEILPGQTRPRPTPDDKPPAFDEGTKGFLRYELNISEDDDKRLWATEPLGFGSDHPLFYFDASHNCWCTVELTPIREALAKAPPPRAAPAAKPGELRVTASTSDGRSLWLIANGRLVKFDPASNEVQLTEIDGLDGEVPNVVVDHRHRLWVAAHGNVYYHDADTQVWHNIKVQDDYVKVVSEFENGVWIVGPKTLLRIGSDGQVVDMLPTLPRTRYGHIAPHVNVKKPPDTMVFVSWDDAIYRYDLAHSRWEPVAVGARELAGSINGEAVTDADGNPWARAVTVKGSLTRTFGWHRLKLDSGTWYPFGDFDDALDAQNARVDVWFQNSRGSRSGSNVWAVRPSEPEWRLPGGVTAIWDSGKGIIWGASDKAIQRCFWATRACEPMAAPDLMEIASVTSIVGGEDGAIWLGGEAGLVRYDPTSGAATFVAIGDQRSSVQPSGRKKASVVVSSMVMSSNKVLEIGTNSWLFELDTTAAQLIAQKRGVEGAIRGIRQDGANNLWVQSDTGLVRLDGGSGNVRLIQLKAERPPRSRFADDAEFLGGLTLPDAEGGTWFANARGLSRQGWNAKGFPGRPIDIPFFDNAKNFARVTALANGKPGVWQTRPTGLILQTADGAQVFTRPIAYPITAFERAHSGGVWIGYARGGLSLQLPNGQSRQFTVAEGLPDSSILSISPVPKREGQLWVATNDGAAIVSAAGGLVHAVPSPLPGPVDVVTALPDGSAWVAYNALSDGFFLRLGDGASRQGSYLFHVSTDGKVLEGPIILPRGDVLALATASDGVLWVGATSGLYRLRKGEAGMAAVTAEGTLRAGQIRELQVDPDTGVVWMGIDADGPDVSASLIGYDPAGDRFLNFTPDSNGLPSAQRIDSIDFAPDNSVVVLAGGQLVKGQLIVPTTRLGLWLTATLIFGLLLGLAAVMSYGWLRRRRAEAGRFRPLLDAAREFFSLLGRTTRVLDFRTLLVPESGLALADASGTVSPASLRETQNVPVRCAADDLVPVDEVQAAFKAADRAAGSNRIFSYLVYQRELDPAATRQLDVYRLRKNAVIIPLSRPFLVAKIAEGVDAVRNALDGLRRRYLGEHDLFDARNALDEPRFFFGRRALIDELSGVLSRGEHAALVGPRKSGKSSLLNLLQQRMSQFPVAKIDMQLYSRTEDAAWPGRLFVRIVEAYDNWGRSRYGARWTLPGVGNHVIDSIEFEAALRIRREQQRRIGSDLPLLVLIDEIERVFPREAPACSEGEIQRFIRAAGALRALGQEGGDKLLSLVVADRLPAFNRANTFALGADTNPFYRFFKEFYLEPLQREECSDMLRELGQAMGLDLDDEVIERIYGDSGGYVSLARQLASAACRHRNGSSHLDMSHYLSGMVWIREQSGEADLFFQENFWDQSSAAERRALFLASRADGADAGELDTPGPIPRFEHGRSPESDRAASRPELIDARRMLMATGMLTRQNGKFVVRGDLFRDWLQQNVQF